MPLPVLRIKGDEGQHIDGCFKHIQTSVCADIMEAVSWITALHIQAKGFPVAVGAALMGVVGDTICIRANKHGVVILGIFIQKSGLGKVRHHIPCDAAMLDEVQPCDMLCVLRFGFRGHRNGDDIRLIVITGEEPAVIDLL